MLQEWNHEFFQRFLHPVTPGAQERLSSRALGSDAMDKKGAASTWEPEIKDLVWKPGFRRQLQVFKEHSIKNPSVEANPDNFQVLGF